MKQITYFLKDYQRFIAGSWYKGLYVWMSWGVIGIFTYRIERSLYLVFKGGYKYLRVLLFPLLSLIQSLSHLDINYMADIGPGLCISHYSKGVVIGGNVIIGRNLSLIGGNVIGTKRIFEKGAFIIGDNVEVGANATIIGPIKLGDNVRIGASACVIKDCGSNKTLVGVPAHEAYH